MNIVITGANKGLGLELTREALGRGHQIVAGVRNTESSHPELRALRSDYPAQLQIMNLDVDQEAVIASAAEEIHEMWDQVDAVINNAGILNGRDQVIENLNFDDVEKSMQTNLYGPMKMVKHLLPQLRRSSAPAIINVSSEAGCFTGAYGGDYPYAISKSGLIFFTAQLRKALAADNFMVYAVHPGWIRTPMGGDQAPCDPVDTAKGLLDLVERRMVPEQDGWMINHKGETMPF
ncbi:short-chain dehydrogenase [Paenibacillus sp. Cedars]|nr:SDR family NAD(P)-dependent oxidoreductase [Paenibacillus sp. Cedars]AWP29412.1 short-chain dehydrogenase [Paenibacillus sp. Cedars]